MAESNPTQVILTDDGLKIINAQGTANKVAGNVNDINSDNKLTPTEKLKLKQEYDKDLKLYTIDVSQLQSAGLPTAELDSAMSNLTNFVTPLFKEMNTTSTVNRGALDSVFTAFATADKNASQAFANKVQQVADDAKKAGDDAKQAGEEAQEAGQEAKASAEQAKTDATQAKADALTAQQKAQSSIDQLNAHLPDIDTALSTANLVKQSVTKLSNTTEQYHNEYTTGIQNVIKTIDDISIGGTNLVINSGYPTGTEHWTEGGGAKNVFRVAKHAFYHNGTDNTFNLINQGKQASLECYASSERFSVKPNTQYSLSFKGFASSNVPSMDVWFLGRKYSSTSSTGYDKAILIIDNKVLSPSQVDTVQVVFNTGDCEEGYLRFDNNGSSDGNDSSLYFTEIKVEQGTRATDWSLSPLDTATGTEFDQLSNAIKLKADSSDVTSQINIATKGIQSDVTNKVSDLNTKISQTSDAVQILNTTSGLRNLVYNSSYANNAEGWNMFNPNGYLSTLAVSSYNGSPGFGVSVSGKSASAWTEFGESKHYALPQPDVVAAENTYSGSAMIKMYDDSDSTAKLSVVIAYYDKNGARISWKDMFATYDSKNVWKEVKFENFPVPQGAYSIGIQYWAYGSKVHGMIAQPMIVFGPKIGPYNPDAVSQSDITASINNVHLGVKNADGSTSTFNMNGNTILMDTAQTVINGKTSILDGTIDTAKIANAAINTAQIADGAINNAKIANAAIDDAKISNLNGNKIIARSIAASKINVDDLIANGINTKTLTSVNLNTSTLTTPELDLGLNGTFTEDFDYTQNASMFLPKKNKGNLTFNHGVLQSEGTMQTYVNGQWGGMNDNLVFQSGISNAQWTELAPGYIKMDLCKQDGSIGQRIYADPTGFYYTSATGNKSYLGNVLQTGQVQTPSLIGKYIGPSAGVNLLQIGNNGNDYGLQVGSYAGSEAVLSDFIYNSTTSTSSNVRITDHGHLMRTTSASKYKYNIKNPEIETTLGDRLLNVHMATWNDKHAVDMYAEQLNTGEEREKITIDKYYGLIAEQLRDAGLDMFVDYGKNHEIEGIQYDRAWIPLLSVVRRLNDKVNEYELRLSKLEGTNK
ncbi:cell envelope integrity protein TolA [Pediococcus pentosaceus]|uniref:cell envelope integrity protein TolA n=1 Tax=Pediococcus pentosaceus TaxID=1255 RepID=UPI000258B897|nr:cell envelope integrity protein TolA [Pediococcus pentosaceus]CCG89822.1 putative uncharacterized protein [Pediococcus pentosaceus IE-3]